MDWDKDRQVFCFMDWDICFMKWDMGRQVICFMDWDICFMKWDMGRQVICFMDWDIEMQVICLRITKISSSPILRKKKQ